MISSGLTLPARIAALVAVTLAVLSFATLRADQAAAEPVDITTGELNWGLKESWRNYVGVLGTTMLGDATRNLDGTFNFPVTGGTYDPVTKETVIEFGGGIEFLSHCHGAGGTHVRPCSLDMTLRNPRIELTEDHATIFIDADSRPIDGGDIITHTNAKLADLDIENAEPDLAGGKTLWSELVTTVSLEGSGIFTYPLGTVLDPVTFEYEGPGGKPAGETWDAPGVTSLTATESTVQPTQNPVRVVGELSTGELVGWHNWGTIAILDPNTLEAKSEWLNGVSGVTANLYRDSIAVDPETDTIFAAERTNNANLRKLVTYEWDGTTLTRSLVAGSHDASLSSDSGSGGTWDAANDRYLIARASNPTDNFLWEVKQVDGEWTASRLGRIQPVSPGGALFLNAIVNLEAVPDGQGRSTVVGTSLFGAGHVVRLTKVGGDYRTEKLQEAGDINADRIFSTRNGLYAVSANDGTAAFVPYEGYADNRRLGQAARPVPFGLSLDANLNLAQIAFGHSTDTLVALTDANTLVTRLDRGEVTYRASVDGGPFAGNLLGVHADGDIWGVSGGRLKTLGVAGVSPRFTTQPEAPVARLVEATAEIELSAAVEGSPAPELTWQSRIPGLGGWQDLPAGEGADGTSFTTTVSTADRGRQYRVIAENQHGRVASQRVSLELRTPPSITVQPTDVTVAPGGVAEFKVMPVGNPEPTVQWQQRLGGVWHDIPGATNPTLRFEDVDRSLDGAAFRARLENELGSLISGRAIANVAVPSTEPLSFNGGSADWGISNRWRCYVTGQVARGTIELGTGASKVPGTTPTGSLCAGTNSTTGKPWGTGGESYRFEVSGGSFDPVAQKLEVDLKGSVRFLGHSHHAPGDESLLDTEISDLKIEADLASGQGFVLADASGATMENPVPFRYDDIKLVAFDASSLIVEADDGKVRIEGIETVLHEQGSGVITYPAGEQFDPLSLNLAVGPRKDPDPDPDPEPAAVKPRISTVKLKRLAARNVVARVACPAAAKRACAVRVPAKLRLAAGGKLDRKQRQALRKRFAVRAPKAVAPGKVGRVAVVIGKAQRRALKGKQLRGSLKVMAKGTVSGWVIKRTPVRGKVR